MRKILYIVSRLKRSGPTNQLFNIIKYLKREGFEPHLLTLSPEGEDSRWEDYKSLGVSLYSLNLSRLSGFFLAKRRVADLVDLIKPDLIHTQGIRADVISSALDVDIPRLCTVRNFPQEDYAMTYGRLKGRVMFNRHINAMRKLDCCVGVSEAVEKNLNSFCGIENTSHILNGVDEECYFYAEDAEKNKIREKLSLPKDVVLWVSSGHLSSRKDPAFLIDSWKKYFPNDERNVLLFIGSGPLYDECKGLAANENNVIVQGYVNNVVEYLQAGDYFVSASKAEGLPNAVIEALACGLPVLLSDINPHSEIYDLNNNIGGLYKASCFFSFRDAVMDIARRSQPDMRKAALELVATQLSAARMSNSYQDLYYEYT